MKKLFRFYIQSSKHVALAVTALTAVTYAEFDLTPDLWVLAFVYLGTVVGYNFVKYSGFGNTHHLSVTGNIIWLRIFTGAVFLALIFVAFKVPKIIYYYAVGFGVITMLYAIPLFSGKNMRMLKGWKIFVISAVWAGVTVCFPLASNDLLLQPAGIIELISRFVFVIALTIPFEIRDLKYDENELGTLPQMMGVKESRSLGSGLLLAFITLQFVNPVIKDIELSLTAFVSVITLWAIWKAKEDQHEYYASFWVESIPIVWYALILFNSL